MQLTKTQRLLLEGAEGKGKAMAMQIQKAVGDSFEAEKMVPIARAHVSLSAQAADLWFAGKLLAAGAFCSVAPTVNPGYSLSYFKSRGLLEPEAVQNMEETERIYRGLGAILTYSCTPYLFGNVPLFREICALSETSVTIYANSVLGARTNRESAASALCAAVTGYVPLYGMLLDENRRGTVLVQVDASMESAFDYALLGLMGKKIGPGVPVFCGLPSQNKTEGLIALGTQLNVSGSYDMFHIPGVTPEAPDRKAAFGGREPERVVTITREELEENRKNFSFRADGPIGYAILGCPHYSVEQLWDTARLLRSRPAAVPVYILTSSAVLDLADKMGVKAELERQGAELLADTCVDEACCFRHLRGKMGVTDSPKGLYYMRSFGISMDVQDRETCIRWAQEGRVC